MKTLGQIIGGVVGAILGVMCWYVTLNWVTSLIPEGPWKAFLGLIVWIVGTVSMFGIWVWLTILIIGVSAVIFGFFGSLFDSKPKRRF